MSKSCIPPTLYQIKAAPSVELPPPLLVSPFGQLSHGSKGAADFSWSDRHIYPTSGAVETSWLLLLAWKLHQTSGILEEKWEPKDFSSHSFQDRTSAQYVRHGRMIACYLFILLPSMKHQPYKVEHGGWGGNRIPASLAFLALGRASAVQAGSRLGMEAPVFSAAAN